MATASRVASKTQKSIEDLVTAVEALTQKVNAQTDVINSLAAEVKALKSSETKGKEAKS